MNKKPSPLKSNFIVAKYVCKFAPLYAIFSILYIFAYALRNLIEVYILSIAIEAITTGADAWLFIKLILPSIITECVLILYSIFYNKYLMVRYELIVQRKFTYFIYSLIKDIDLAEYDNAEFYNKLNRAYDVATYRTTYMFNELVSFLANVVSTLFIGAFIITIDYILAIIVVICAVISGAIDRVVYKGYYKAYKENATSIRYQWYAKRIFYLSKYTAELKTTKAKDIVLNRLEETHQTYHNYYNKLEKKNTILRSIGLFIDVMICDMFAYIYFTLRLFGVFGAKLKILPHTFTAGIASVGKLRTNILMFIDAYVTLSQQALYIDDFIWITKYVPKVEKEDGIIPDKFNTLEIKNLTFTYPLTDKVVLNNLNMTINQGDHLALVGINGSGKSTLIKLINYFYHLDQGNILYNGIDYKDLNPKLLRKHISCVYQDYNLYAVTIAENILMRKVKNEEDEQIVKDALNKVGLLDKVNTFSQGIHTPVTKEFKNDGELFSGGETQRLIIARVFATDADIYILDEPTAALDPLAEAKINDLILNIAKEKTIIIIAHRLSTVVNCDRIYLLDNGNFSEVGTHQQLLKLNKKYAQMFNTQKKLYEKEQK